MGIHYPYIGDVEAIVFMALSDEYALLRNFEEEWEKRKINIHEARKASLAITIVGKMEHSLLFHTFSSLSTRLPSFQLTSIDLQLCIYETPCSAVNRIPYFQYTLHWHIILSLSNGTRVKCVKSISWRWGRKYKWVFVPSDKFPESFVVKKRIFRRINVERGTLRNSTNFFFWEQSKYLPRSDNFQNHTLRKYATATQRKTNKIKRHSTWS